MSKAEYVDRARALEILQKIEEKRRGCNCSKEAIRQADAIVYAQEVVRQIKPSDVIPFEFIREWFRREANYYEIGYMAEFLIEDWRKENEQKEETEAL